LRKKILNADGSARKELERQLIAKQAAASWQVYRLACLSARAGQGKQAESLAESVSDRVLRGRAQLEILRARLKDGKGEVEESALKGLPDKDTLARAQGGGAWARD